MAGRRVLCRLWEVNHNHAESTEVHNFGTVRIGPATSLGRKKRRRQYTGGALNLASQDAVSNLLIAQSR